MLDPPALAEGKITAAVKSHYNITVSDLAFLPLGADSASWVFRLNSNDGLRLFLKLRASDGFSPASLAIPFYLKSEGLPHIVAPYQSADQSLWVNLEGFALSLYPFIDGRTGADSGLSELQWQAYGALAHRIHSLKLPSDIRRLVAGEKFIPSRRRLMTDLEAVCRRNTFSSRVEREFSLFWRESRDKIRLLVERADALGDHLRGRSDPRVLCHADMHTWNVLLDRDEELWLIDWDDVVLGLKERDLMFVVGGIGGDGVGARETTFFLQGYGEAEIDPEALSYYRYAWAVQDIAANGETVFFSRDLSEKTRKAALQGFIDLFEPGNIVPRALESKGMDG